MDTLRTKPATARPATRRLPPLENGDRLTTEEYERRYEAMPEGFRAELLEGIVYVNAAVRRNSHGRPHAILTGWLFQYETATPHVELTLTPTVRLADGNNPEPDAVLEIDPRCGGATRHSEDDRIEGPPALAVEIAASSASIDLHVKRTVYERNGVSEYLVWNVHASELTWFSLAAGRYETLRLDADGILRSRVLPGLWLDVRAVLARETAAVLATLARGTASEEHRVFRERLAADFRNAPGG